MGGAKVHCTESGVGHFLCKTEAEALDFARTVVRRGIESDVAYQGYRQGQQTLWRRWMAVLLATALVLYAGRHPIALRLARHRPAPRPDTSGEPSQTPAAV